MMKIATLFAGLALALTPAFSGEIPRKAPELVIPMADGSQKLLSSYRGKVVVLQFIFTTCSHCQQSCMLLSRLEKEYGAKGLQPLALAWNDMAKMFVPDFIKEFKITFPVGYADRNVVNSFLQNPPSESLHVPQLVFIDRKGMIRMQSLPRNDNATGTEANIRTMIEKLLAEKAGPTSSAPAAKKAPAKKAA
ncbi:MAG: TlpA disulfide reductase family protein [Bryobacteraceae bacterium]|nr:TlpA disulfide reductase family protein [Bryobacteraceae bacterium]